MTEPTSDQQPWQQPQAQQPTQQWAGQQWAGQQWPQQPQPGYGQPPQDYAPPAYPYGAPVPPPRKSRRGLWIGGSIGAVVVLIIVIAATAGGGSGSSGKLAASPKITPVIGSLTTPPAASEPTTPADNSGNDESSGSPQNLAIGKAVTVTDDDGNATDVTVNSVKYQIKGCGDSFTNPEKGQAYLVIDVTYVQTKGVGSYNEFDWSANNPTSGDSYDDSGIFSECKPELGSSNGLHGKHHGKVVLEVPKGFTHGQVLYTANLFDDDPASWKF